MAAQERIRRLKVLTLLLALVALGAVILRAIPLLPPALTTVNTPPLPTESPVVLATLIVPPAPSDTPPRRTPPLTSTPADEWANAVLDCVLPVLTNGLPPVASMAWWQSSSAADNLSLTDDNRPIFGNQPLEIDTLAELEILIPDLADPTRLSHVATMEQSDSTLSLSVLRGESIFAETRWVLMEARLSLALKALIVQARLRGYILRAAYGEGQAGQAQLVLVDTIDIASLTTPTPQPTLTATSPRPTRIITPTPTRVPEAYMGRVMAGKIDPVIDATASFDQGAVSRYTSAHPWVGPLTWTETGPQIAGRPVAVEEAQELNFYTLQANDPTGAALRFLSITFDGTVTRFPDDQIMFQDQRTEEVLFWLARRAAERGGQLIVAYDDFGLKQSITVVDFRPFIP